MDNQERARLFEQGEVDGAKPELEPEHRRLRLRESGDQLQTLHRGVRRGEKCLEAILIDALDGLLDRLRLISVGRKHCAATGLHSHVQPSGCLDQTSQFSSRQRAYLPRTLTPVDRRPPAVGFPEFSLDRRQAPTMITACSLASLDP